MCACKALQQCRKRYCRLHMNHRNVGLGGISRGYVVCYSSIFLIKAVSNLSGVKQSQTKNTHNTKSRKNKVEVFFVWFGLDWFGFSCWLVFESREQPVQSSIVANEYAQDHTWNFQMLS